MSREFMRAPVVCVPGMSLDLGRAAGGRVDRQPRRAYRFDERRALVERPGIVVQVALGQANGDVGIERREIAGELAAGLEVERRAQTLVDDAHGARDGLALGRDVAPVSYTHLR